MSVHDRDKYPEIKKMLGIPADEPIFILRAQDNLALGLIDEYARRYGVDARTMGNKAPTEMRDFIGGLRNVQDNFAAWRLNHLDGLKFPD